MRSLFLLLVCLMASSQVFAQTEIGTCADARKSSMQRIKKKTRAGNYDNALMSRYDVHFYFLDLNIERNSTVISGSGQIGATITVPTDTFCFELNSSLTIDSIILLPAGNTANYVRVGQITYIILPSPLALNTNFNAKIYYKGNANTVGGAAIGDGFSTATSQTWQNQVTWSLSEPYSAYEWFPCKQFLQDKADSSWVFVTTSNQNRVGSNGLLVGVDSLPNNKVKYRWKSNYVIDYYLISIAVAKYVDYTYFVHPPNLPNDSVMVVNYVYDNPNCLPTFKAQIDSNGLVLEYLSEKLGLYPFHKEKYGHAMAPFGGGMEHQTMTSVGNLGNFSLNAHELMHQWFGDYVTCKTWKDIVINEGFASYGEYLAYEHFRGLPAAQADMAGVHNDVMQDANARVYFTDTTDVNRIFSSRLTYNKGNAVVHTMRFVLGDSLFFAGLRNFLQQYANATASIDDLKTSMEAFTGVNLSDYFSQWLYGYGHPIFSGQFFANGSNLYLRITHTTSSVNTTLFKTPLEIKCTGPNGDTTVRVNITANSNDFIIPYGRAVTNISIDPNNWLLNKVGNISQNAALQTLDASDIARANAVDIWPNPAGNEVSIVVNNEPNATFALFDMQGRLCKQGPCGTVETSTLSNGVYVIRINTGAGTVHRSLHVRH
jgi:aminopeptidase N